MAPPLNEQQRRGRPGAPREGARPAPRSMGAKWNLLLVLAVLFFAAAGCQYQNSTEKARRDGAEAGKRDGQGAGDADGYKSAYEPARDDAYDAKLEELYASDKFNRRRSYTFAVLGVAFLSGFGLQYGLLYLLRRKEFLLDIDRIVLPKHKTRVDLTQLLDDGGLDATPALKRRDDYASDSTHDE